ncbi:hypothetical protein RMT89_45480, partial [Streptomyces sp. P17]
MGSSTSDRQITRVAAGTERTDAVNRGQLDAVAATADGIARYVKASGTGTASASGSDAAALGSG